MADKGAQHSLEALAELVGGWVEGDSSLQVRRVSTLADAGPEDLSFLTNPRYRDEVSGTQAAALLVDPELDLSGIDLGRPLVLLRAPKPYAALARIHQTLSPPHRPKPGIHPRANVSDSAHIGADVFVGPLAVIEDGADIGPGCVIEGLAHIGRGVRMGKGCVVHAQASIRDGGVLGERVIVYGGAIVGSDGFGYAFDGEGHQKIPQVGNVILEDDVEVGAGSCIDRATFGSTVIGRGTKIDNLVQVGHNCRIEENVLLVAQTGLAGSAEIGAGAALGGQVGVAGHRRVGAGARIAAKSGVAGDIPDGAEMAGIPAIPRAEWLRHSSLFRRLGELRKQLAALTRRVNKHFPEEGEKRPRPERAAPAADPARETLRLGGEGSDGG